MPELKLAENAHTNSHNTSVTHYILLRELGVPVSLFVFVFCILFFTPSYNTLVVQ